MATKVPEFRSRLTETLVVPRVDDLDQYSPDYKEPREIGCFSIDEEKKFFPDGRERKFLYRPLTRHVRFDLNIGYEGSTPKDYGETWNIHDLLRWLLANKENPDMKSSTGTKKKQNPTIASFNGTLRRAMCTPYERQEGWIICATMFRGIIFLCPFDTEQGLQRRSNVTEREKLMTAWGYKFEQYMVTGEPGQPPDTSLPVNENREYCSVALTTLNRHSLLFRTEIDGIDLNYVRRTGDEHSPRRYVEFKTSKQIDTQKDRRNFYKFKLLNWWAQPFLAGVSKVICGFRDHHGIVHSVEELDVNEIPRLAEGLWSPSVCLNFLDMFLSFVKKQVVRDNPKAVYKFEWRPGRDVECTELKHPGEYLILPDWFLDGFQ